MTISPQDLAELGLSTSKVAKGAVSSIVTKAKELNDNQVPPPITQTQYPGDEIDDSPPLKDTGFEETLQFKTPLHLGYLILPYLKNGEITPHKWQIEQLEQITDDFSVALLIWMSNLDPDSLDIDIDISKNIKEAATELQQHFKTNIYGK